jgi:hypothetical protein
MFNSEKYKWLCEQLHDGTHLRVNSNAGYDIAIHTVSYEQGRILANYTFDITNVCVYGYNSSYQTMEHRYPSWLDEEYYYSDPELYEWRALKNV